MRSRYVLSQKVCSLVHQKSASFVQIDKYLELCGAKGAATQTFESTNLYQVVPRFQVNDKRIITARQNKGL